MANLFSFFFNLKKYTGYFLKLIHDIELEIIKYMPFQMLWAVSKRLFSYRTSVVVVNNMFNFTNPLV